MEDDNNRNREKLLEDLEIETIKQMIDGVERGVPTIICCAAKLAVAWPKEQGYDSLFHSKSLDLAESLLQGISEEVSRPKEKKKKKKKKPSKTTTNLLEIGR